MVTANLPTLNHAAEMTMDRAAGLSEEVLEKWTGLLAAGITEETLADEAEVNKQGADADDDGQLELLEAWEDESEEMVQNLDSDKAIFPGLDLTPLPDLNPSPQVDTGSKKEKPASVKRVKEGKKVAEPPVPQISTHRSKAGSVAADSEATASKKRKLKRKVVDEKAEPENVSSSQLFPVPSSRATAGEPAQEATATSKDQSTADAVEVPVAKPMPLPKKAGDKVSKVTPPAKPVAKSAGMPDFKALEKLVEPQAKADGSALDAFFSNQDAPSGGGGVPAPAININLSQPPKKKGKRGGSKSKPKDT